MGGWLQLWGQVRREDVSESSITQLAVGGAGGE